MVSRGTINRAVFIHGEDQRAGQHRSEIAARDDLVAVNFVRAVNGVGAERYVGLAVLEFGVDGATGIAVLAFGAASTPDRQSC